ncbi:MAG: BREX-2 system adenine-specific DNA-methyltransferase PglX, partial [Candidatus Zixiibacteriota bacterium]
RERYSGPHGLTFAFVSTSNHFSAEPQGAVYSRTSPVIKFNTQGQAVFIGICGELNSSIAGYWMKQTFQNRGSTVDDKGARQRTAPFEDFYEFTGTGLQSFPVAEPYPLDLAREIDSLAQRLSATLPTALLAEGVPTRAELDAARDRASSIRRRMIALQEELDWRCYALYGVVAGTEAQGLQFGLEVPEVELGQRAFEIVMARRMAEGELETTWFDRHGSTPVADIPDHWPAAYRAVVEKRIALIDSHRYIGLVEKPEYKRRWQWSDKGFGPGWDEREKAALERWLLDRLETEHYWAGDPALKSVNQLADLARADSDFCRAASLYEGQDHPDLSVLVARLVAKESVPFHPGLRYSESGRRKRVQWERVWNLQRREDAGENVGTIDVPPKYKREDFQSPDFWRLRGGLDVPKERFISYPGAEKSADGGLMVAWAGFDHLAQARALASFYHEMKEIEGWDAPRLIPLLAGLADLLPWLKQWHNAYDSDFSQGPGDWFAAFLSEEARALAVTLDDISAWQPAAKAKGKRGRKKASDQITLEDLGL